jgi:serine phosphatase RsbU (regulator of sigma subunit)
VSDSGTSDWLDIQGPDGRRERFGLEGGRVSLGRSRDNDICYPDDASLSRVHLTLETQDGAWFVQDQRSKNGTKVNGENVVGRRILVGGDRIQAGRLLLVFHGAGDAHVERSSVEFYPEAGPEVAPGATLMTSLDGLLSGETAGGARPERPAPVDEDGEAFRPEAIQALIRAGRELATHRPLGELFELILDLSIQAVGAERGVLLALEGSELRPQASRGEGFRISVAVRDRVVGEKRSILVKDVSQDEAFRNAHSLLEQNVRTIMAVPLQTDQEVLGLVYVDSKSFVRPFRAQDLNLLTVLANVAAIRIEHQRLQEVEQNERLMARDLSQAASIQAGLVPSRPPVVQGLDVSGSMTACRTVGGDYYDFFEYEGGRLGVVLADVAGKGLPAALVMTNLQAQVRLLFDEPGDLAGRVGRLDQSVAASVPDNKFISMFFGRIDPTGDELVYCNAGHNPPILVRADGSVEFLEGGGTVLGMLPELGYETRRVPMRAGDLVMVFSDGVTEATDTADEEYGQDRLVDLLREHRTDDAATLVVRVTEAIREWAAGAPPADDVTMVIARRT